MDTSALAGAYRTLLDAAATVAGAGEPGPVPPPGEWDAEQILAHVSVLTATTLVTVATVACGSGATYDNRPAQDGWTLGTVITRAGGAPGLRERLRRQGEALCLAAAVLGDAERAVRVPTLLVSHGTLLVDAPMPLGDLLTGLADAELPGHAAQLLALLPPDSGTRPEPAANATA
ncbi:hypothetical protein [Actinacidiphila acidipaludis]|uniref:DinB-like domain-containing protein n=1 Tax=Actinacidiphila acidipaludis TaxID=2873382 RepID=A0ABS7Q941_9ACTN|nr:hypothetical protein [Streptomyces acidipaludis]MBY8878294.1 hypothetical protein [Streptomyces acidipaludis]